MSESATQAQTTPEQAAQVRVYSKDHCRHCVSAKSLLERLAIPYEEIDLTGDVDAQVALARRTGQMTLPQIEVNGQSLGGFNDLQRAADDGRLSELLDRS